MKRISIFEGMNIGKVIEKYKTDDINEFIEVNCFHCKKNDLKLSPEACLSEMMMMLILLSPEERDFFPCSSCENDLIRDYGRVLKKRAEKRNLFVDELQLADILKEFLKSNIVSLTAKYGVDQGTVYSLLRNHYSTLF